jgi:hypothetical protein
MTGVGWVTAAWTLVTTLNCATCDTVDAILEQCIRFLTMPPDQQRAEFPNDTEAERREMNTWLPGL